MKEYDISGEQLGMARPSEASESKGFYLKVHSCIINVSLTNSTCIYTLHITLFPFDTALDLFN